jgi:hypothetical protein
MDIDLKEMVVKWNKTKVQGSYKQYPVFVGMKIPELEA